MKTLEDVSNSGIVPPQSVLIYGSSKTGKTVLAASVATKFPVLYISLENGEQSIVANYPKEVLRNIQLLKIPDTRENPVAAESVAAIIRASLLKSKLSFCVEHGKVACTKCKIAKKEFNDVDFATLDPRTILILDSVTQLSDSVMVKVAQDVDGIDLSTGVTEYGKLEFDHYGHQGRILAAIFSGIQNPTFHWIAISHDQELEQIDKNKKLAPTVGTRNFARSLPKYFGHVIYTGKSNGKITAKSSIVPNNLITGSRSNINMEKGDTLLAIFEGTTHHALAQAPELEELSGKEAEQVVITDETPQPRIVFGAPKE